MQLAKAGLLGDKRVELIEGEIYEMALQENPHAAAVSQIARELFRIFDQTYFVKIQSNIKLDDATAPEPDFAVLPGEPTDEKSSHPQPLLVIEVSDTTLSLDRGYKASLYAAHAVEDYWVANLRAGEMIVHREPIADAAQPHGWRYNSVVIFRKGQSVAPLAKMSETINLSDVLR